jgi:hypothetical protein
MSNQREYTCAICRNRYLFTIDPDDEKIRAEYHRNYPGASWEERVVICEDCWKEYGFSDLESVH